MPRYRPPSSWQAILIIEKILASGGVLSFCNWFRRHLIQETIQSGLLLGGRSLRFLLNRNQTRGALAFARQNHFVASFSKTTSSESRPSASVMEIRIGISPFPDIWPVNQASQSFPYDCRSKVTRPQPSHLKPFRGIVRSTIRADSAPLKLEEPWPKH